MKQCPNCRADYADDSLRFCLNDGAALITISDPAATVQMPAAADRNQMRVPIAPDSVPTYFSPPIQPPPSQPAKKSALPIIVGVLGLLLLLAIGGIAAFLWLRPTGDKNPVVAAANVSPTPTAKPTADETAKLREEMANLQKQLQDRKNQKPNATSKTLSPPKSSGNTARVNSPGDGFLALRSQPNSETGYRILQIPHGANVSIISCQDYSKTSKRRGRWCQVDYNGNFGWAFDAYLVY